MIEVRKTPAKITLDAGCCLIAFLGRLRKQLQADAVLIPFGLADGLGVSINRILVNMRQEIAAGAPHPIISATNDVLAVTRTLVAARIREGDVILD